MRRERLSLYDTTLRDGAQTLGVDFSVEDKWLIAEQLDSFTLDEQIPRPSRGQALPRVIERPVRREQDERAPTGDLEQRLDFAQ